MLISVLSIYQKDWLTFSPLKESVVGEGIDIMIIRELVGGLYFGEKETGVDAKANVMYVKYLSTMKTKFVKSSVLVLKFQ